MKRKKIWNFLLLALALCVTATCFFACGGKGDKGDKGEQGVSIVKTELIDGELVVTYSDGRKENLGAIPGESDPGASALDFYPLPDGTYGVKAGNTEYLEEIVIPATYKGKAVTQVLNNAFSGFENLKKIIFHRGLKSIGSSAFKGCSSLKWVEIPGSVTDIGEGAFLDCASLERVVLSEGVNTIGNYAFQRCASLTSVTIPESVSTIGQTAFRDCYRLVEVIADASVLGLEKGSAQNGCLAQYALDIHSDGKSRLTAQDDFLFYTVDDVHYLVNYVGNDTELTLPAAYRDTVYKINRYAFSGCADLTSVTIPDTVTEIGDAAFQGCSSLESVALPESVAELGAFAFADCTALDSVTLPKVVRVIGESAFVGTAYFLNEENWSEDVLYMGDHLISARTSLKGGYTVRAGTKIVANGAFYSCIELTELTLPDSLTDIGSRAFGHCSSLRTVQYDGSKLQWEAVSKEAEWDYEMPYYTVKCEDGNISKPIIG